MSARPGPRVAVIGCGQIADAHVMEARRAGAVVAAVCDANPHVAEGLAARAAVPAWFSDPDALLERARPEVVHVTTPPETHLALARQALAAGAHVYVEKPVTVDAREAELLAEAARGSRRLVCVGHNLRFDPAVRRLQALLAAGALGEVVHAEVMMAYDLAGPFGALVMSDPDHWVHRLPGGLAHNNLSHPLSLVLPLLGDETPAVLASGRRLRPERLGDARDRFHDEVRVLLEGRQASAAVQFSCRVRPAQLSLVAYGTRRTALLSIDARTLRLVDGSRLPGPFAKVDWARRDAWAAGRELLSRAGDLARARLHYFEGMRALFRAFYDAVSRGGDPPIPLAEVKLTADVLDRIFAACHRAEHLPEEARAS
jgi:predicted dehydrogenase